jgi:hypothetical protein
MPWWSARSPAGRLPETFASLAKARWSRPDLISCGAVDTAGGRRIHCATDAGSAPVNSPTEGGKQMSQMLFFAPTIAPVGDADSGRSVPSSR